MLSHSYGLAAPVVSARLHPPRSTNCCDLQIQSNGQFLLRNIPALRCCSGANLLHCRSPFYLCFEHVDNLGAYRIPPETGLLIPSVYRSYRAPTFRGMQKSRPDIERLLRDFSSTKNSALFVEDSEKREARSPGTMEFGPCRSFEFPARVTRADRVLGFARRRRAGRSGSSGLFCRPSDEQRDNFLSRYDDEGLRRVGSYKLTMESGQFQSLLSSVRERLKSERDLEKLLLTDSTNPIRNKRDYLSQDLCPLRWTSGKVHGSLRWTVHLEMSLKCKAHGSLRWTVEMGMALPGRKRCDSCLAMSTEENHRTGNVVRIGSAGCVIRIRRRCGSSEEV
jgi:hypothetical protein